MSGTVDNAVVSMTFDNAGFESKLQSTLEGLNRLKNSLDFSSHANALTALNTTGIDASTSHIASSLSSLQGKFSALGVVGATAISKLTSGFMGLASNILNTAKTDILSPIITGGKQRAQDLQQAKFQFEGLGINVNQGMASALAAVKGTAYGLNDAAMVAAQFGASGIKAGDQMTRALTGISGVAAMTGRSYSEIGQIFTSMAGQGKVSSMDLMEFGIRGVNAAAAYGKVTGKTEAQVRQMVSAGKVGFPEFADAMDKAFGKHATDANQTYTGSLSNLHAALSRMGASFFSDRLVQERDLFNALTPVVDSLTSSLKPLTTEILKVTAEGTKGMIKFLGSINFKPLQETVHNAVAVVKDGATMFKTYFDIIKTALKDIFPGNLMDEFGNFAAFLDNLIQRLTPTGPAIEKITIVFKGLFAVFSIAENLVHGLFDVFAAFFDSFTGASAGTTLSLLDRLANAIIKLQTYLVVDARMSEFFGKLQEYAQKPADALKKLFDEVKKLFDTLDGAEEHVGKASASLNGLSSVGDKIREVFTNIGHDLDAGFQHIVVWFHDLGSQLATALRPPAFQSALSAVNTGLLGGILLLMKGFLDKGLKVDIGGGVFGSITTGMKSLQKELVALQLQVKADIVLKIAEAVAVMAASMLVLSMIKPDALQAALLAMAVGFTQLVLVMKELDKVGGGVGGAAKLTLLGTTMIGMSTGVLILAGALKVLSSINPNDLAKGMSAIAVSLALLVGATKVLSESSAGSVAAGIAFNAMATGLAIMAGAVRLFAAMSWDQLIHGLAGIAGVLLAVTLAMTAMPVASTIAAGLAMIPLAIGLTIMGGALKLMSTMSWGQLAKGLVGLAAGLVIIAAAMQLMPLDMPIVAAGLILVGVALGLIVPTIKMIGSMDLGSLAKALGGLAIMLTILAVATQAMSSAVPGALALLIVANSMLVLSVVMKVFGSMSWGDIIKGLAAMAGTLLILGLTAAVLQPLIPALLGLGVAMTLVGAGFALFGLGAFLVASAFALIATAGTAGTAAIILSIDMLLKAIPTFVSSLITSLAQSGDELLKGAGLIIGDLGTLLDQLLALVVKEAPNIAAAIAAIVDQAIVLISAKFPDIVTTAFNLLMAFLGELDKDIPQVVAEAVKVLVGFADELSKHADKLVSAAFNVITSFIEAIAKKAGDIASAGLTVLVQFLTGIANNIGKVTTAVGNIVTEFITSLGKTAKQIIDAGTAVLVNLITGLGNDAGKLATAGTNALIKFLGGLANNAVKIADACGEAILDVLDGIDKAIRTYEPQIIAEGLQIGKDLITGAIQGVNNASGGLLGAIGSVFSTGINVAKKVTGQSSPSKVFAEIGKNLMLGAAIGINGETSAQDSIVTAAENIVKAFEQTLSKVPNALDGIGEFSPTITPVLDLSKVQSGARGLSALLSASPIAPNVSTAQAGVIATTDDLVGKAVDPLADKAPKQVVFNQTINSPTSLSTNDIYRNTNSQIAKAKEELNI